MWVGAALAAALALMIRSPDLSAQDGDGSMGAAIGGAALGAYSGTALGLLGGFGPCNRTLTGVRCTRIAAAFGGVVGMAAGIRMGSEDSESLRGRFRGAGYGAVAGGLLGYGLSLGVRQYGWYDVGTFMAVGAGIGASPAGVGVGFGAGAAVGVLSWLVIPRFKLGDAVAVSLVGSAVGGLAGWVLGTDSDKPESFPIVIPFQVRF